MSKDNFNPLLKRYSPAARLSRYSNLEPVEIKTDNFGMSITDKEAYRLQLVNGVGANSGCVPIYDYPDGKYDATRDFSTFNRPDLGLVEKSEMIENLEATNKARDESLNESIKKTLEEQKAKELKVENNNSAGSEE